VLSLLKMRQRSKAGFKMAEETRDPKLNRTQTQAALRRRPSVGFLDLHRLSMSYWTSHATSFFIQLFGPP
jgi:hypothetical protein